MHPSYEISSGFMSIGFRETVIVDNNPQDRNFYLFVRDKNYTLIKENVLQLEGTKLVFDTRERILMSIDEKWNKNQLLDFIRNPIRPRGVYDEIKMVMKQYLEFQNDAHYGLITAWIIATYFHRCFNAVSFLFFYGKKGTGKSRCLDFLERLAFNANKTQGISVASLADTVDGVRGAFLFDQAESLSNPKNEEILGIMADSYTVGGGKRRIVNITNNSRKVVEFETFAPKAFASWREINSDLKDRCIEIRMPKTIGDFPYPEAHLKQWGKMRDRLYRLLLTNWRQAKEIYQNAGVGMAQRVKELWKPLDTILKLENVSEDEQTNIRNEFLKSMELTQTELDEREYELFTVLKNLLKTEGELVLSIKDIADMFDTSMGNFKTQKDGNINQKSVETWIGKALNGFNLYIKKEGRRHKRRAYRFSLEKVEDIFNRFTQTSGLSGQVAKYIDNQNLRETTP